MKLNISELPAEYQRQIRKQLVAAQAAQEQAAKPEPAITQGPTITKPRGAYPGAEKDLQAECERWLINCGFQRRSKNGIKLCQNGRYFVHINQALRNPILLDLLVVDAETSSYIEIELKCRRGALTEEQAAIVCRGHGVVCWNMDQFVQAMELFLYTCRKRKVGQKCTM